MTYNKGYEQYRQNTIYTSSPEELTLMLYNGLIKFIMLAQQGIEEKNIEKASNSMIRAQDIVAHFKAALDMQHEVSNGLDALYEYMHRRLVEANIHKDPQILDEVLGMAKELRDTWGHAMKLAKQIRSEPPLSDVVAAVEGDTRPAQRTAGTYKQPQPLTQKSAGIY